MRDDFAKTLVERPRALSRDHYHNYRHNKDHARYLDEDGGGRVSMRKPYGWNGKSFNEHLNPMKGWLHSCLGKNWDKCYSELRTKFDTRSTINNHIMDHLWQYIEVNTKVVDGVVMGQNSRWFGGGYVPVNDIFCDYYVCPKNGTVKKTNRKPYKTIRREDAARRELEKAKVTRVIDADNVLHCIDDVWYHFTIEDAPHAIVTYVNPYTKDHVFFVGFSTLLGQQNERLYKTWAELNGTERERFGQPHYPGAGAIDLFTGHTIFNSPMRPFRYGSSRIKRVQETLRYHATKQTASHKLLKKAGIVK
jgi:hypothetical protein